MDFGSGLLLNLVICGQTERVAFPLKSGRPGMYRTLYCTLIHPYIRSPVCLSSSHMTKGREAFGTHMDLT